MGHELDINAGIASFADSAVRADGRVDAWHGLGQAVGNAMTAEEAMREAHLGNWDVRKMPLEIPAGVSADGSMTETIPVPDKYATVRTNPVTGDIDYLGVVGERYTPVQNEALAGWLDAIVDEGGAHFETAGALRGGREIFLTMKLPSTMDIVLPNGYVDSTEWYIAGLNSHDGSKSLTGLVSGVRIVCANTQSAAIGSAPHKWTIRHTSNVLQAIDEARRGLGLSFNFATAFESEVRKMIQYQVDTDEAKRLLEGIFEVNASDSEKMQKGRTAHVDGTLALRESDTNTMLGPNLYQLWNSVTEYVDWAWPFRGSDQKGVAGQKDLAIFGDHALLKERAFRSLTKLAN